MTKRKFAFFENEAACSDDGHEKSEPPDDYDCDDSFIASEDSVSSTSTFDDELEYSDHGADVIATSAPANETIVTKKRGRPPKLSTSSKFCIF